MTLALVIPVCDDVSGARAVVAQAVNLGIFAQIILCDDASEVPLAAENFDDIAGLDALAFELLHTETRQGAGAARNLGLAQVCTSHLLFFDADDHLLPPLADLWHRLQGQMFDFCVFKHLEQRNSEMSPEGMFPEDEARWQAVGARQPLSRLEPEAAPALARVAAYPWNKIYRTDFLRDNDISCVETLVHNDIALHWLGFMRAQIILCADLRCCAHVICQGRDHLTNRRGSVRLQVFEAVSAVLAHIGETDHDWRFAFTCFYLDLLGWARERVQGGVLAEFDTRALALLRDQIDQPLFVRINREDPFRARRITETLARGG